MGESHAFRFPITRFMDPIELFYCLLVLTHYLVPGVDVSLRLPRFGDKFREHRNVNAFSDIRFLTLSDGKCFEIYMELYVSVAHHASLVCQSGHRARDAMWRQTDQAPVAYKGRPVWHWCTSQVAPLPRLPTFRLPLQRVEDGSNTTTT
jgi:hypothetical protein